MRNLNPDIKTWVVLIVDDQPDNLELACAALEFFYPRLSPGGIIFIHDYNHKWEGVERAVDEFIRKIPETLVLVPDLDGSCMIIRNKK